MARKPTLLVVELWGLGDLVIASPFLQVASRAYEVTLLARPYALELGARLWPQVRVVPFIAPWTAFRRKYHLLRWPWRDIFTLRHLTPERYDLGLSARWDPRDHLLLRFLRPERRLGFSRLGSRRFLTDPLPLPEPTSHRLENWRALAKALNLELPARERLPASLPRPSGHVLVHTGAGQPVRVWPLPRYKHLVDTLRTAGLSVRVACDPDQLNWWLLCGESAAVAPTSVNELLGLIDQSRAFIGNDSGPAHLAGFCGVPTFTIFGPQLPEWFAPLNPGGDCLEGKACPYKPCSDYCRFDQPYCITRSTEEEVLQRVKIFLARLNAS